MLSYRQLFCALLLVSGMHAEDISVIVTIGDRSAVVRADGTWSIPNLLAVSRTDQGMQIPRKIRARSLFPDGTLAGSIPFSIVANAVATAPVMSPSAYARPPLQVRISAERAGLSAGQSVQLVVEAFHVDRVWRRMGAAEDGIYFSSSNPTILQIDAEGLARIPAEYVADRVIPIQAFASVEGEIGSLLLTIAPAESRDYDDDGMTNEWEVLYGFDPNSGSDAAADRDNDGLSNLQEHDLGTNPVRPDTDDDTFWDGVDPEPLVPESVPPTVVVKSPLNDTEVNSGSTVVVEGIAADNAQVRRVVLYRDGVALDARATTGIFMFSTMVGTIPGSHQFEVRAIDASGNSSLTGVSVRVRELPNQAPIVAAGADQEIRGGRLTTTLSALVSDDGWPSPPGTIALTWSLVDGPGLASISAPLTLVTEVTVSEPGAYRFRVEASDSLLESSDEVVVAFVATDSRPVPDDRIHLISGQISSPGWASNRIFFGTSSTDGRYVAISTDTPSLASGDANASDDVYLWDRVTGITERISIATDGGESSGGYIYDLNVSDDGRRVSFMADGIGLAPGDVNGAYDLFVRDRQTGTLVIVNPGGIPANSGFLNQDGRFIVFTTTAAAVSQDRNATQDVYVRDLDTGYQELISVNPLGSEAGGGCTNGVDISSDGRYIAFISRANNLVDGDIQLIQPDAFLRDRLSGTTRQINVAADGVRIPGEPRRVQIEGDVVTSYSTGGSASYSLSGGVVPHPALFQWDVPPYDGLPSTNVTFRESWISGNGRYLFRAVYWLGIDQGCTVLVYDYDAKTYLQPLRAPGGSLISGNQMSWDPRMSDDGRMVAFVTEATDLVAGDANERDDILVFDRQRGSISRVSLGADGLEPDRHCGRPAISGDGQFVAFDSAATNLVGLSPGSSLNLFLCDLQEGITTCVSRTPTGATGGGASNNPSLSRDGRYVLFSSTAPDLVPGDTNGVEDAFIFDRLTETIRRVNIGLGGAQANGAAVTPNKGQGISGDGRKAIFFSTASNLVPADVNGSGWDLFLVDLVNGSIELVNLTSTGAQATAAGGAVHPEEGAALSADGRAVAFTAHAPGMVSGANVAYDSVYLRDLATGTTSRIAMTLTGGPSGWTSTQPSISGDGRLITYQSEAADTVSEVTYDRWEHLFLHDRVLGTTKRISVSATGSRANDECVFAALSANGRFLALESFARNLTPGIRWFSSNIFGAPVPKFINAGPDRTVEAGIAFTLTGEVPTGYAALWSVVNSQAIIAFGNPSTPVTSCLIDEPGTYTLRLTATKGAVSEADEVTTTVTVMPAPIGSN